MDLPKKVHIIGIGGIGVSAVAKLLLNEGVSVSGSDAKISEIATELIDLGATITAGHQQENLPKDAELVIYTSAVPDDNPELSEARRLDIKTLSYFQFLGLYSREKKTIAVAGTNGKSTTTAMLGMILAKAGLDPTVIVGSKVPAFGNSNLRIGKSDLLVVEACEHEAHLLVFNPYIAVITNVEEDHLDFYHDLEHIMGTFSRFVSQVDYNGFVSLNLDDTNRAASLKPNARLVGYGFDNQADYQATNLRIVPGAQRFTVEKQGEQLGELDIRVPGRFNVYNALAAVSVALELGVDFEIIRRALLDYVGIWRRFELLGEPYGAPVISDYGHHPTAVVGTLEAVKEFYPDREIVLVFQPHQRNRTRNFFERFVESFDKANHLIIAEIFDVKGREKKEDIGISSADLVKAIKQRDKELNRTRTVSFAPDLVEAYKQVHEVLRPDAVTVVMGAGDIDSVARKLVSKNNNDK